MHTNIIATFTISANITAIAFVRHSTRLLLLEATGLDLVARYLGRGTVMHQHVHEEQMQQLRPALTLLIDQIVKQVPKKSKTQVNCLP